jgi:protein ImuB
MPALRAPRDEEGRRSGRHGCTLPDPPLAIVAKAKGALRIEAVDRAAAKLGIGPGLTLADARARVPTLSAAAADPAADARLLREIALFCGRFTPMVAVEPPDGLTLDVTGCAHLFGGEAALRDRVVAALARRGVEARAALADGPDAARAFARFARVGIAPSGEAPALARRLPLAALELPAQTALALARAGLSRVGDLEALPPATLSARFGAGVRLKLDRLLGREERRITPLRPPPDCVAERRFPAPLLESAALMEALARLVADVSRLLESRGRGGRRFVAAFFRTDGAVRTLRVETGRPCRDPALLLRLFRERMDALADPIDPGFGFDALRLEVPATEALASQEPDFDRRAAGDSDLDALVDRLTARFGRDRVQRFRPVDSHDPAREAQRVAALDAAGPASEPWRPQDPHEPPLRPLQMFDPPQPVEVLAEVPDGPPLRFRWRRVLHEVARAEGPERIAPEWWRAPVSAAALSERDYYRIEDAAGRRFWVFREGLYGGAVTPRWFLHGLFA